MKSNKTTIIIALTTLSFSLTSCSDKNEKPKNTESSHPITQIEVREIKPLVINKGLTFSGRIEAKKTSDLSTRLMGKITSINVNIGDAVSKGNVLFTISKSDLSAKKSQLQSQKKQAQVVLNNLKKDKERTEILFSKKSATAKQLDDINTAYYTAEAKLTTISSAIDEINSNLEYATVKAPFDGFISAKHTQVGNISSPGIPVISIVSKDYKAKITVPESHIKNMKVGNKVTLKVPSQDIITSATITQVSPSGSFSAGQFIVTVVPNEPNYNLRDGLYAQVNINSSNEEVILLNENEIVTRGQLTGVFTLNNNNEAILNWIRIGRKTNGQYLALSGVKTGDKVITSSGQKLLDGQKVSVKK